MKKFKVSIPYDYVCGYLRYGHGEAIIEAETIEELKERLSTKEGQEYFEEVCGTEVDSYEVTDCGKLDFDDIGIEEVTEQCITEQF